MPIHRILRYVQADHVKGGGAALSGVQVEAESHRKLGEVDGIIVDPTTRRLHYVVVREQQDRYLMPLEAICFDPHNRTLRTMVDQDLRCCPAFEPGAFEEFGDEDLISAMFGKTAA